MRTDPRITLPMHSSSQMQKVLCVFWHITCNSTLGCPSTMVGSSSPSIYHCTSCADLLRRLVLPLLPDWSIHSGSPTEYPSRSEVYTPRWSRNSAASSYASAASFHSVRLHPHFEPNFELWFAHAVLLDSLHPSVYGKTDLTSTFLDTTRQAFLQGL